MVAPENGGLSHLGQRTSTKGDREYISLEEQRTRISASSRLHQLCCGDQEKGPLLIVRLEVVVR